jgi:predicted transcriptional regulator
MNEIGKVRLIILFAIHDGARAGRPPSLRELVRMTGTQIFNVWHHLDRLRREGLIRKGDGPRSWVPSFRFITPEELEG